MTIKVPTILRNHLAELTPQELEALRALLLSPTYLKLLSIAECMKPSANGTSLGSNTRDAFSSERANARLGEIRGWELHQASIFATLYPKPGREPVKEEFQEVDPTKPL